jgi:uncharacterized membrane protein
MAEHATFPAKTGFWGPLLWVIGAIDIILIVGFVWKLTS